MLQSDNPNDALHIEILKSCINCNEHYCLIPVLTALRCHLFVQEPLTYRQFMQSTDASNVPNAQLMALAQESFKVVRQFASMASPPQYRDKLLLNDSVLQVRRCLFLSVSQLTVLKKI